MSRTLTEKMTFTFRPMDIGQFQMVVTLSPQEEKKDLERGEEGSHSSKVIDNLS